MPCKCHKSRPDARQHGHPVNVFDLLAVRAPLALLKRSAARPPESLQETRHPRRNNTLFLAIAVPLSRRDITVKLILFLALLGLLTESLAAAETVGKRPYELDWAGRTQDDHPPLVDFEDLAGWTVHNQNSMATFERTREQQIWGQYVGKLTYHGDGEKGTSEVRIAPPSPIPIPQPFDTVTLWCYGNTWGWVNDPSTPHVAIAAVFLDAAGQELTVPLYTVDWTEWYLLHRRLSPDQISRVRQGAKFDGIQVSGGRQKDDRVLYFDNLAVFTESFPPLQFEPRPARGIPMFPGETVGTNTGPGKLPFPTRAQTILPTVLEKGYTTTLKKEGGAFVFTYAGPDGRLTYRYEPKSGSWSDLTATWQPARVHGAPAPAAVNLKPCVNGGVYLATPSGPVAPTSAKALGITREGDAVVSRWTVSAGSVSAEALYTFRLWGKSLVIDTMARGGTVSEVRYGRAQGATDPRLVTNPYYPADGGRPAVLVSGSAMAPLFLAGNTDWYLSNASDLWAANAVDADGATYNGGTRYLARTDGKLNDCYERFFLTLSPRYEEVLPNIPNPSSPWKKITGTHLWEAHGAGNRDADAKHWTDVHRHGITQMVVTDHETMWRDGGESFTFRTRCAPGKGGDQGEYDYARLMQDKLGFVYGPYNNYTDFAPVNEYWQTDRVARTSDNQLQHAWMRCYAPKPARAVEFCAKLAPLIQQKFHFSTAYCDVHTAVAPWNRVDFDARVPGAGTFAAVFYAFGEIMLHQKDAWNGPVYSEGGNHAFYCGLTDGNYGQDQSYRPAENPWLVDFDLRKMHDLCCNFGMGNPDMFYAGSHPPQTTPQERDAWLDRFLAATVAFGHPGFLVTSGGTTNMMRSYFMLQQLHSRYCLASPEEIRYVGPTGDSLDTSAAVASGAYRRSQVTTRYADGTVTAANGNKTERMVCRAFGRTLDLPPNGYCGWTADGAVEVLSADPRGHRCDYAATPAYLFVDGRGRFMRFAKAAGNGTGVCRILPDGKYEFILLNGSECGFAVDAQRAVALDHEGKEIGPAAVRTARGLTYVVPVPGAFSYLLSKAAPASITSGLTLTSNRDEVVAGETVTVHGKGRHEVQIPSDARPGDRIWRQLENAWIDFTVVPLAETHLSLEDNHLRADLQSNLGIRSPFQITLSTSKSGQLSRVVSRSVKPGAPESFLFDLGTPTVEDAEVLRVSIESSGLKQEVETALRTVRETVPIMALPEHWTGGICLRGGREQNGFGTTGAIVNAQQVECGGVGKEGLFMHPPWQKAVGYTFVLFDPVDLPADIPAAFRASVGKVDGSDPGDGILYRVRIINSKGEATVVAEKTVTEHTWMSIQADLSPWAGQSVKIELIADPGPADNTSGDWSCWAEYRIESRDPVLHRTLESNTEQYRREPGPYPIAGLSEQDLKSAHSGWLRYDGKGLEGHGPYRSFGVLNGVELGEMEHAGGDEVHGVFENTVGVALTPEAIRSLAAHNRFLVKNPNGDSYSIRRFWIELELADGRRCSSDISTATYSQPPDWTYAEGIGVPFGTDVSTDVWFLAAQ